LSIAVVVTNGHRRYRLNKRVAREYVCRVLKREGKRDASVSLIFVDSVLIRRLNRQYLRHDFVTDVLAFPLGDPGFLEGEIYVNVDRARQQASSYRVTFGAEIARLVIHGTLHLAGYDDSTQSLAGIMKHEEDRHVRYWFDKRRGDG